jgi:hypothetical protein
MWKQLLFVALVVLGAIALDLVYNTALQSTGTSFDFSLALNLLRWRPLILIAAYTLVLATVAQMLADRNPTAGLSWTLLALGLVLGLVSAFPPGIRILSESLYTGLESLATSRLGLTMHTSALLAAVGILRLLRRPA